MNEVFADSRKNESNVERDRQGEESREGQKRLGQHGEYMYL